MKVKPIYFLFSSILILFLLSGCASTDLQQPLYRPAPWTDGEVSNYDVLRRDASLAGSASWSWQAAAQGWTQSYDMLINGQSTSGRVEMDQSFAPLYSIRDGNNTVVETRYQQGKAVVSMQDGADETEVILPQAVLDNDSSLQALRALPFAENYNAAYTNFVPASAMLTKVNLKVIASENVEVPAGTFETWHLQIDFGTNKHDIWYGKEKPNLLVKYINNFSGSEFQLRSWQQDASSALQGNTAAPVTPPPQDEDYLPDISIPFLLVSLFLQYPLMLLFPLFLGWYIKRRFGMRWALFGYGAVIFIASQVVHLPLNSALGLLGGNKGVALLPLVPLALIAGLSAAVCEEGSRWLALRFLIKHERGWKPALQLGAGHGAAEAIIFGLLAVITVVSLLVVQFSGFSQMGMSGEEAVGVRSALIDLWSSPWYMPLLAGLERVFAITCHIAMTVMVMRSFTSRRIIWLGAAIAFHTLLDFWAVWASRVLNTLWTEAGVALVAAAALWLIFRLRDENDAADGNISH